MYTTEQISIGEWVRKITADSYRVWKAFYHTTKWKHKRKDILKRDHNACQMCRQKGKYRRATTVHHIKHLRDSPELALTTVYNVLLAAGIQPGRDVLIQAQKRNEVSPYIEF